MHSDKILNNARKMDIHKTKGKTQDRAIQKIKEQEGVHQWPISQMICCSKRLELATKYA